MKQLILLFTLLFFQVGFTQNNFVLAETYYREGAYKKASQIYKDLYNKNPYNTTYLKRLVSCYQEENQFNTAKNLIKHSLKSNPNLTFLYVILGHNYERQQQKDSAEIQYKKALTSIDKNPNFSSITGYFFKEYNLLDEAILAYKKGMLYIPKNNFSFQIAQIYGEQGDFQKMFQSYINMVDKNEDYLQTVQRYISKYITEDAENKNNLLFKKTLLQKSISNPKNVWNLLLSWLFTQQKEYRKAFIQEKAVFYRNPDDISNIASLGKIAFENKDYQTAQNCFDFMFKKSNYNEDKLFALNYQTKIAVATKNPETEELFSQIFTNYGKNITTLEIQISYANFLTFQKNDPQKALLILKEALSYSKSKFGKAKIKLKIGDVLVFTSKFNEALIYFSQIQTKLKNHPLAQEARFKVAQTSYFKGDFTWAKAQLKVLKSASTQLIANDAVDLFILISDNEPVDSIPSGLIQYAHAEMLSYQQKNEQAINVLQQVITNFKGHPIEDEAYFKQAKLFITTKNYERAVKNYQKIISLYPEGILIDDAYYDLAELYNNQLKNTEKAKEYYQKVIFDFPSSIYLVDARKKFRKLRGDQIQ